MPNPILTSDILKDDGAFTKAIKDLEELKAVHTKYISKVKKESVQLIEVINSLKATRASERGEIKKTAQNANTLSKEFSKYVGLLDKAEIQIQALKVAQAKLNKVNKLEAEILISRGGSMERMNAQLKLNKIRLDQMTAAEKRNTTEGKKLVSQTERLTVKLKTLKDEQRQSIKVRELERKVTSSQIGSYNRLSAQYSLNKIRLNAMSKAQRSLTTEGRKLERATRRIYEEMDRLQKKTGKAQLSVGKYKQGMIGATRSMVGALGFVGGAALVGRTILNATKSVMQFSKAQSKLASILGKTKSEIKDLTESAKIYGLTTKFTATQVTELHTSLAKLGFSKTEITLSTKPIIDFAAALDVEVGPAAKVAGAALRSFDYDASQMGRVLSTLGVLTTKSAAEFEGFETLISTTGATARQFGFEIEDLAALYGVLKDSGFEANKAATATRNILLNLADTGGELNKKLGGNIKTFDQLIEGLVKLDKDGISLNKTLALTDKRSVTAFGTFLVGAESAKELRHNVTDAAAALQEMVDTQMDNLAGDITLLSSAWNGFILSLESGEGSLARATRGITTFFTNALIGLSNIDILFTKESNLTTTQISKVFDALLATTGKQSEGFQEIIKSFSLEKFGKGEDNRGLLFYKDTFVKYVSELGYSQKTALGLWEEYYNRRAKQSDLELIADQDRQKNLEKIKKQNDKSEKERGERNEKKRKSDEAKRIADSIKFDRITRELKISAMSEGQDKELAKLAFTYDKKKVEFKEHSISMLLLTDWFNEQKDKINTKWANKEQQQNITDYALKLNLQEDSYLKSIELLKLEYIAKIKQGINKIEVDKWYSREVDKLQRATIEKDYESSLATFEIRQELARTEFDLHKHTELEKTRFTMEQEKARIQFILDNAKDLSDEQIQIFKNQIKRIEQEIGSLGNTETKDIYDSFGIKLSDKDKENIKTSTDFAKDQLKQLFDKKKELANEAYLLRKRETDQAQETLNNELKFAELGYASNVEQASKELALSKRKEKEALAQKQKAAKQQLLINTALQASNIITATANIWKGHTEFGPAGVIAAIAATGVMWGSFIASKLKANQLINQQYGEGGYEEFNYGGSHSSGNDISLGMTPDGKHRKVERGESMGIFNKKAMKMYGNAVPEIVRSINNGKAHELFNRFSSPVESVLINNIENKPQKFLVELGKDYYIMDENGNVGHRYDIRQ